MKKAVLVFKIAVTAFSVVFFILFFRDRDLKNLPGELKVLKGHLLEILLVTFCMQIVGVAAWMNCFRQRIPVRKAVLLYFIDLSGESAARVTPANFVAGDALKIITLTARGTSRTASASSVFLFRIFTWLSGIVYSLICLTVTMISGGETGGSSLKTCLFLFAVPALLGTAAVLLVIRFFSLRKLDGWVGKRRGGKFPLQRLYRKARRTVVEMAVYFRHHRGRFLAALACATVQRFGGAVELFVVLNILHMRPGFFACMLFEFGILIARTVFSMVPLQIGVEEAANKTLLKQIGALDPGLWLTVSIVKRTRQFIWIAFGFSAFLYFNLRSGKPFRKPRQ